MHAGYKVLHVGVSGELCTAAEYTEHGMGSALAYGADWRPTSEAEEALVAVTCSFYDRALHAWQVG